MARRQLIPLRHALGITLVLLALIPALLVAWLLNRATAREVDDLAGKILAQVAASVQLSTENHLQQAHAVLNGLFPERMTEAHAVQARKWLQGSAEFEPMAFALMRQAEEPSILYRASKTGDYLSVAHTGGQTSVGVRKPGGSRNFYLVETPGERNVLQSVDPHPFEPRTRSWYFGAADAKGRVFSPVQVDATRRELMVSLAQPVYDYDGGIAGVFGTDLYLQALADLLRTQRISARGAAFIVDERMQLVASSAGDALFAATGGGYQRRSPRDSVNPVVRASFTELEAGAARRADAIGVESRLERLRNENGTVLMVQRPFAEKLGLRWTLVVAAPESDFTAEIETGRRTVLAVLAGLALASVVVAVLLARGFGHRLRELGLAAERMGRGEVPTIDHETRIREVHQLSQVLHDSAQELQRYREQVRSDAQALHEANETLEARVEHRTAELAASREEALAAARAKAAFLATMSHEIRTPLNGVVGMSTLLAETPLDAEQRDYLKTIRLSSDQLLAVISDILDFSKIESGRLELEAEPFSPRMAVEEACDIAAPYAREKGIELIVDVPQDGATAVPPALRGDVTRLRQVLINLVNNAVKFTSSGEVGVHVRTILPSGRDGSATLEFRVTDTGIGIPPERVGALFDAFTQVDASTTRKYGGTGLGLAICKRLVELMGGRVGVESRVGKGSTFWFTIVAPTAQLAPSPDATTSGALAGKRALVVDDNATNIRILTRQLQDWGLKVAGAASAAQALQALRFPESAGGQAQLPDIVITDMHMPEMDGLSLAQAMKADARLRDVPLVLLSSGFMPAGDEGAHLFQARLLKPVRQLQLFETVARCVASDWAAAPPPSSSAGARRNITVLVADDNAVNLRVARAMLLKLGYDVLTAAGGQEAVEAVAHSLNTGPALGTVLMDLNMPHVDGLDATRQIHAAWGASAPPIIALTAAASAEDRERCVAAGMDDYLTKPLQVATLAAMLDRWTAAAGPGLEVLRTGAGERVSHHVREPLPEQPALMDWSRLDEFREFDDAELSMTREVIGLFIDDLPARVQAIEQAVAAGDASDLLRAAHALKGAAANIGAAALQAEALRLERDSAQSVPPDASGRARDIGQLADETRIALAAWPKV